jgi:hypothetical protein
MFCETNMNDDNLLEELQRLRMENEDLRRASEWFGALAERLNDALRAERESKGRRTAGDAGSRSPQPTVRAEARSMNSL